MELTTENKQELPSNEEVQTSENLSPETSPEEVRNPHPLDDDLSQRFLRSIQSVEKDDNIFEALVDFIASGQSYMVAVNMAREPNHKQGKLRFTMNTEKRELMKSSEEDFQVYLNNKLDQLFINMVEMFIKTHPILESMNKTTAKRTRDMMKILYIMLLGNGQYDVIMKIESPDYIKPMLEAALKGIDETAEKVVEDWVSYLNENESEEMAQTAKTIGIGFFNGSKAIDSFEKYFKNFIPNMKKYEETYSKFLELRAEYSSITTNMSYKSLYKYFDISDDTFVDKRNKYLIPEFQSMFTGEEYSEPLKRLVFGGQ